MKKKLVLTAAVIAALSVVSCNGKKTNSQGADQDSLSYAENDSLNSNDVILDSIAGTYEGTLPAADCPGIKTVLTALSKLHMSKLDNRLPSSSMNTTLHCSIPGRLHIMKHVRISIERFLPFSKLMINTRSLFSLPVLPSLRRFLFSLYSTI